MESVYNRISNSDVRPFSKNQIKLFFRKKQQTTFIKDHWKCKSELEVWKNDDRFTSLPLLLFGNKEDLSNGKNKHYQLWDKTI